MFCPEVFYSRTPWMLFTECDTLFSSTIVQSFTLTPDVIHTAQGLWYPGVQNPEQGRPGARWAVPPEVPLCAVQVHPAMAISDDMWRQGLQRLLSICVSKDRFGILSDSYCMTYCFYVFTWNERCDRWLHSTMAWFYIAMLWGTPTIQFLTTYSMQKRRGKARFIFSCELYQCLPR